MKKKINEENLEFDKRMSKIYEKMYLDWEEIVDDVLCSENEK
jgi:hypothetical protein